MSEIELQQLDSNEFRALIHIKTESDPERYGFTFNAAKVVVRWDGSAVTLDKNGSPLDFIASPWAVDADGKDVPTHFEVDGNKLIQVVDHKGRGFNYQITADPDWWEIAKCSASIGGFIATNAFAALKIKKVGGIAKAVEIIFSTGDKAARIHAIKHLFGEVTGIGGVIANCT